MLCHCQKNRMVDDAHSYVHNQMYVVVLSNEKCKIMYGKLLAFLGHPLQLSWPMKPGKMSTTFVHGHFGALELVQFLADGGLVLRR